VRGPKNKSGSESGCDSLPDLSIERTEAYFKVCKNYASARFFDLK